MSRFNPVNAAELARQSYRFRLDDTEQQQAIAKAASPLLGKEAILLQALQDAEETYNEWLLLGPARRKQQKLMASFPRDCERLGKHLERAMACWANMQEYGGQYELALNAACFENATEAENFIRNIDDLLQKVRAGARTGSQYQRFSNRGRPRALEALEEFTKVMQSFWVKEVSDTFGYDEGTVDQEDERREPTSAAARLIMGAAKILDNHYTIGHVRDVMEAVYHDPQLF